MSESYVYRHKTLVVLSLVAAIGGFLFGYDTGVVSGSMLQLRRHFNLSYAYQETVVSATIVAAAIFSHASCPLNERFGRRPVITLASVLFIVGSLIMGAAFNLGSLICGRFVVGAGVGLASMTVPVYIAECSPSEIRGRLIVFYHLLITFGQVVAAVIDGIFQKDLVNGWR
ncbi:unnamed protein product [Schistocephalus solidus]|uniref:MFS domain-containing protein n=1 Tax=Schistocephalus solidus TaxID=70667 RepID=A0A183S8Q4_SCHSO|nr:unnamed protein product [Schistocephalus solidus]